MQSKAANFVQMFRAIKEKTLEIIRCTNKFPPFDKSWRHQ